jgi:hypothetical protein
MEQAPVAGELEPERAGEDALSRAAVTVEGAGGAVKGPGMTGEGTDNKGSVPVMEAPPLPRRPRLPWQVTARRDMDGYFRDRYV